MKLIPLKFLATLHPLENVCVIPGILTSSGRGNYCLMVSLNETETAVKFDLGYPNLFLFCNSPFTFLRFSKTIKFFLLPFFFFLALGKDLKHLF